MKIKQKEFIQVLNFQHSMENKQINTKIFEYLPKNIINEDNNIIYLSKGRMSFFGGLIEFLMKITKIQNNSTTIFGIFIGESSYSLLEAEKNEILVSYFNKFLDDIIKI